MRDASKRNLQIIAGDLGILGFLIGIFGIMLLMYYAQDKEKTECLILFLVLLVPVIFCVFKMRLFSFAITGLMVLSYTVYKIYMWSAWSLPITLISYVWVFIPVWIVGCLSLYEYSSEQIELKNELLSGQVEELVMIDPLTGLYNRKSLYNDLEHQIAYTIRNEMSLSLMIIELKYEQELRSILSKKQFEQVCQTLAERVEDSLRLEDRLYAVDNRGSVAVLLYCDKAGAGVVAARLRAAIAKKDAFRNVMEKTIKVDVKIGYLQYDKKTISNGMELFKKTENELQYDV